MFWVVFEQIFYFLCCFYEILIFLFCLCIIFVLKIDIGQCYPSQCDSETVDSDATDANLNYL